MIFRSLRVFLTHAFLVANDPLLALLNQIFATLGSILDSQLSWESGKFQLAAVRNHSPTQLYDLSFEGLDLNIYFNDRYPQMDCAVLGLVKIYLFCQKITALPSWVFKIFLTYGYSALMADKMALTHL